MAKLDILIPTFNRAADLDKNLRLLDRLATNELSEEPIRIIVSDNCSTDNTQQIVAAFKKNTKLDLFYHRNEHNIGLEPNVVEVLQLASAPHVMFIGDDDYIAKGYLQFVFKAINENAHVGIIISGIQNLLFNGEVEVGRNENFQFKELIAGYGSALYASHLAHQLSGLVLKREGILDHYLQFNEWRNPYLFIHFATYCLLKHGGVYAPKFKTTVTVFNEKDWGYNKVGLLDEVFKSYYPFRENLGVKKMQNLLLRFSVTHSYRYDIKWNKPYRLFKQFLFLTKATPRLPNFKFKLGVQLLKEYILALKYAKK